MSRYAYTLRSSADRAPKACRQCGSVFGRDARYTWAYFKKQKYCSQACAGAAWSKQSDARRPDMRTLFNSWVVQARECWEWTGARDKDGYGIFSYARKSYRAPVIALKLDGRPVPKGMYACHTCDNPACVKPLHLYPGTPKQNMADAVARKRIRYGKKAKLTEEAVRAIRGSSSTDEELSATFGVSRSNISMVRSRRTWRHVP